MAAQDQEQGQQPTNQTFMLNEEFLHSNPSWSPAHLLNTINVAFHTQLTAASPQANQPEGIRLSLRAHQKALIHAMEERERQSMEGIPFQTTRTYANYGVLGDEVGSGKSLVVLGYIAKLKAQPPPVMKKHTLLPYSNSHFFTVQTVQPSQTQGSTLIIVPHTIYRQWQDYCKLHTSLNIFFAKSHKEIASGYLGLDSSGTHLFKEKIQAADAILVSNTLYPELVFIAKRLGISWRRVFLDEADSIHIPSTNPRPAAMFTWFITATWPNFVLQGSCIRPSLLEYYEQHQAEFTPELGNWLREEVGIQNYAGYSVGRTLWMRVRSARWLEGYHSDHALRCLPLLKCSKPFLDESQKMPQISSTTLLCEQPVSHRVVAALITPAMRNMLHAGNIEGVLQELGIPEDTPMNLVDAVTHEREKELDRLKKTLAFKEQLEYATPQAKEVAIATLKSKITSVEEQLKTFKERLTNTATEECPVCYEDPKQSKGMLTPCCHRIFCAGCILESLTRRPECPMCRAALMPQKLTQLVSNAPAPTKTKKNKEPQLLSKPKQLLKFLKENPNARVLVFSRYENPFVALEKGCDAEGIQYHTLRGNKDVIASTVKSFEKGEKRVLFLPMATAGAGLNLVSASHVVLLHAMTPEEEKQVVGRAYRLGRTEELKVVRLLHDGESVATQT